jgi:predicted CopG family antitoxin
MGRKTISLDGEAYERLKAHKREGESFSAVVKRLAGGQSWQEIAGIWAGGVKDLETAGEEGRKRSCKRRERTHDELG